MIFRMKRQRSQISSNGQRISQYGSATRLRRLCSQTKLEAADITALASICKAVGARSPARRNPPPRPRRKPRGRVTLGALLRAVQCERPRPGRTALLREDRPHRHSTETMAPANRAMPACLSSCAVRVRRKATESCPISTRPQAALPAASIDFFIGAQKRSAAWTQGTSPDAMLSAVSVFDSRTCQCPRREHQTT